jgi:hypothetical protein
MRWLQWLIMLFVTAAIMLASVPPLRAQTVASGDALPGAGDVATDDNPPITVTSTVNGMTVGFAREYGKTTIWLRVCADAPNFQMRSEQVGAWQTEIFHRTAASGGCSPNPTSWWRMVFNIDAGTGTAFRIYGTANDAILSEEAFMRRAARTTCFVTGYGTGYCTPDTMRHTAPEGAIDEPVAGATIQGQALIRGWVVDGGSWNGTGVNEVRVALNGTEVGTAAYGEARGDVAAALGDPRFTASQYRYTLDTTRFANGPAILQVRYRLAHTGAWFSIDRQVTINNPQPGNRPPNPPILLEPAAGATTATAAVRLQVQDGGDPDNGPRPYRDYFFQIAKTDGSWSAESGWIGDPFWNVTLPTAGVYRWQVLAGDGAVGSAWAGPRDLTYAPPSSDRILNVRYVDQVFAQRVPLNNYWVYCGPATLAMLLHFYGVEQRDVFSNRAPTVELAREMGVGIYGTPGGAIPAALKRRGLNSRSLPISVDAIRSALAEGHPVILSTRNPNHISLIIGVRANGNFVVHDPMGGKNWARFAWKSDGNRNDQPWARFFDAPREKGATLPDKGQYVEYSYSELAGMGIQYLLQVTGASPAPQARTAQVNTTNGTFIGQDVRITFGDTQAALASTTMMSLTHIPQREPDYPIDGYTNPVAVFRLSAQDAAQQPVERLAEQFTIQVDLDPLLFTYWNERTGSSSGQFDRTRPAMRALPITEALVLAVWDSTQETWVPLPTTVDPENHQVTAQSAQFGAYAVLTRPDPFLVFLPTLRR